MASRPSTGPSGPPQPRGVLRSAAQTWLDGPARAERGAPGARLGLPSTGRGSVAGWGPRVAALLVDFVVADAVALVLAHPGNLRFNLVADGVLVLLTAGFTALSGRTVGHRLLGLQLVRLDGRRIGWWGLPRALLLALLVPAVIVDRDRRGLHDRIAGAVVVRVR